MLIWQLLPCLRNPKQRRLRYHKTAAVGWKYRAFHPEHGLLGCIYCSISITVPRYVPSSRNLIICIIILLEQFSGKPLAHPNITVHRCSLGVSRARRPFPAVCLPAATLHCGERKGNTVGGGGSSPTSCQKQSQGSLVQQYVCRPFILSTVSQLGRSDQEVSFQIFFFLPPLIFQGSKFLRKNRFHLFSLDCCIYHWKSIHWPFVV